MSVALILSLLKRFWWAPIMSLLLAYGLVKASGERHYHKLADQNAATAKLANDKLSISNASIDTLTAALNAKNAESEARAKAYADTKAKDATTIAEQDQRFKTTKQAIDALLASAAVPDKTGACRIPSVVAAGLEGL